MNRGQLFLILGIHYPEYIPNLLRKCLLHNPSDRPSAIELVEYLGVHIPKEKPVSETVKARPFSVMLVVCK